jgi:predicted esterase
MQVAPLLLGLVVFLAATICHGAVTRSVIDVQRPSGIVRVLLFVPDTPAALLIMLTGGDGVLGLTVAGDATDSRYASNPPSRDTQRYLDQGYAVAHVDTIDQFAGLNNPQRATRNHFEDLSAAIQQVRSRVDAPTWLVGYSAGTVSAANLATNLPAAPAFGLVLMAPVTVGSGNVLEFNLESFRGPAFVVTHALDPCPVTPPAGAQAIIARLSAAARREQAVLNGGVAGIPGECDAFGYHGWAGLEAPLVNQVATWVAKGATALGINNYQGLWYRGEVESGWGLNVAHQGNTLFITWFTYDTDGSQMWLVGPDVRRTTGNTYAGPLYRTTGPAFNSVPFDRTRIAATAVGTATLTFADADNGTFAYTVGGTSQSKPISRQVFGPLPVCAGGAPGASDHYQDLWYAAPAESESGWGVNITQQGDILFATWFTYDAAGRGMWVVGPRMERSGSGTFAGALFRTTGPAFSAAPWSPALVAATQVGTATFTFTAANAGTFAYTLGGVTQSKPIVRQAYAAPVTVCR